MNTLDSICGSLCHSFMRFVKVIIFANEILQEDLLAWKVYYKILFLFLLSHMFPWMNKLQKTFFSLV